MQSKLTHIERVDGKSSRYLCECGKECVKERYRVKTGQTKSCGCLSEQWKRSGNANRTHAHSKTPEYNAWCSMKQRCYYPKNKRFERYGGRGITVCERWRNNFANFLSDMGLRPSDQHSIERIDNDKGYCKENCKWGTQEEQGGNKSTVPLLDTPQGKMPTARAARTFGLKRTTLRNRLYAGWTLQKALTTKP